MNRPNLWIGVILLIGCSIYFYETMSFPSSELQMTSAAFIPRVYCLLMFIFSAFLMAGSFKGEEKEGESKPSFLYSIIAIGLTSIYIISIPFIGFYVATLLFIVGLLFYAKVRSWIILSSVPIGTLLFIYVFFVQTLNVTLPTGTIF
ncbi:tripartite tricarboxylate transporter TctB family protein [Halobacillus sp. B23F22_1]|uniref:tripartite tricarboxylate transporter TctB family protein n=1 Tax=Halobacillus sp. B23F22_1 TaxID=3459514 RepID=UPI00373F8964